MFFTNTGSGYIGKRNLFLGIDVQATLVSGIGSLDSIPRHNNMKNEDEDAFRSKQIYSSLNYQRDEE
jgi:hypothetical protein